MTGYTVNSLIFLSGLLPEKVWEREKMTDRLLLQYAVNTAFLILFCGGNERAIKGSWLHCWDYAVKRREREWKEGKKNKSEFQVKMCYEIVRFV